MRVSFAEGDVVIDGTMTLGGAKAPRRKSTQATTSDLWKSTKMSGSKPTREGVDDLENRVCGKMLRVCGEGLQRLRRREAKGSASS